MSYSGQFAGPSAEPAQIDRLQQAERVRSFYVALLALSPRAWCTPALVAANVAVFAIMVASGVSILSPRLDSMIAWGANYAPKTQDGQWWRLLTCTFLHFGILHLAVNMYALWSAGHFVERLLGSTGFLIMYLLSGLAGSLASLYWHAPGMTSAGASGAVFGVFGALLGFVLRARHAIPKEVFLGLRNSVLSFLVLNIVLGTAIANIDMAAHLGGFVGGFVCGLLMGQPLDEFTRARRIGRNLATAVLGGALVVGGIKALPEAPADMRGEFTRFIDSERNALRIFNAAQEQVHERHITVEEFADQIENDVLPPWRAARERLTSLKNLSPHDAQRVAALIEYSRLRSEHWDLLAQALRMNDPDLFAKAKEKDRAVAESLERINQQPAGKP